MAAKVFQRVLGMVSRDAAAAQDPRGVKPAPGEMLAVAAAQLLLLAAFSAFGRPWEYVLLWILPLATVANFLVSLRAFVEHATARPDAPGDARLYDFAPGPLQRFLVSPCLFHLHALHHAYPGVPWYRLPALRRALAERGIGYAGQPRPDYVRSLREVLQDQRSAA